MALKVVSAQALHKSDLGGVELNLGSPEQAVRTVAAMGKRIRDRVPGAVIDGYLVQAMTAYREGRRDNAIMNGQMRGFSDAEIQALAIYYHQQSSPLAHKPEHAGAGVDNDQGATQ